MADGQSSLHCCKQLLSRQAYLCNSFLPAFNDLIPSNGEFEGLVPVSRGVKLLSILQCACRKQLQSQPKIIVKTRISDHQLSLWSRHHMAVQPFQSSWSLGIKVSILKSAELLGQRFSSGSWFSSSSLNEQMECDLQGICPALGDYFCRYLGLCSLISSPQRDG